MLIGILMFAMAFGGLGSVAALIAGWSLVATLGVYSGASLLATLAIALGVTAISALRDPVRSSALTGS